MIRLNRLLWVFLAIIFFSFLSVTYLPYLRSNRSARKAVLAPVSVKPHSQPPRKPSHNGSKKFFSWFPFGDLAEQHEAFRTALRIAVETKRIIIAPKIRLGKPLQWVPFEMQAKRYEAQDKMKLRQLCASNTRHWRTDLEPCETINEWAEIPWSSVFNLTVLSDEFGITIVERETHGWGVKESTLGGSLDPDDVVILDPQSFAENATDYEPIEPTAQKKSWFGFLQGQKVIQNAPMTTPLTGVVRRETLMELNPKRLIQFGALSSAPRIQTSTSKDQMALKKIDPFTTPSNFYMMVNAATNVVKALGGTDAFNSLHLNFDALIALGPSLDIDSDGNPKKFQDLDEVSRNNLMNDVVREVFGDIPINQAVSMATPIQSSELNTFLEKHPSPNMPSELRYELLQKCLNYRNNVEPRYPIYYVVNDAVDSPADHPELFGPLFEFTPCIFSKIDMMNWGILEWSWINAMPDLIDYDVDYKTLLTPLLDILIDAEAYSFFELPPTRLTRMMLRQKKKGISPA